MSEEAAGRRPTIINVAKLAGVSHQTVSRFLKFNGDGLKEATRVRISAAIKELDYRPNLVARAMRNQRTGRLAILLPAGTAISSLELLTGASAVAHEHGYTVEVVILSGAPAQRAVRALELADSGLFEGLLSLTPLPLAGTWTGRVPLVVSPDYDEHMRSIGELADAPGIAELIEQLAADGHRHFVHLAGDYAHASARRRKEVYLETIQRLDLRSHGVVDCQWSADIARQAVLDLPAGSRVTAVIGANDVVAAGAIRGAWERGWRVPTDLSVTGWDNNRVGAVLPPALTTVAVDHEALGRRALSRLLAVLRNEPEPDRHGQITHVIWRESTGVAPSRRD